MSFDAKMDEKHIHKKKILIIDDEDLICEILEAMIGDHHYVQCITNPTAAIEIIKSQDFDLVMTDFFLTGITALDIIQTLKDKKSKAPIIVMTGEEKNSENPKKCISAGACYILEKPFKGQQVILNLISTFSL